MRHFIGGFGLGAVLGFVFGVFCPKANNLELAVLFGVLLGLAAWGLLP